MGIAAMGSCEPSGVYKEKVVRVRDSPIRNGKDSIDGGLVLLTEDE